MGKSKIYVDTAALIAFRDSSDTHHSLFAQLFSKPPSLLTSSLVVAEAHGWFLRRYDRYRALQLLDLIDKLPNFEVYPISAPEIKSSVDYLKKFQDQELTLTDACGLWLMKKHRVSQCWSTDHHLSLTGVPLVIHQ